MRFAALALVLLSLAAPADIVSPAPDSVRVTLYGNLAASSTYEEGGSDADETQTGGLVMVSETRTIDLPAGTSRIVFLGVADAIVPQTAGIGGLPAAIMEFHLGHALVAAAP